MLTTIDVPSTVEVNITIHYITQYLLNSTSRYTHCHWSRLLHVRMVINIWSQVSYNAPITSYNAPIISYNAPIISYNAPINCTPIQERPWQLTFKLCSYSGEFDFYKSLHCEHFPSHSRDLTKSCPRSGEFDKSTRSNPTHPRMGVVRLDRCIIMNVSKQTIL